MAGERKVAVIGAGSTYTPELVSGMAGEAERAGIGSLSLHDIDESRLEIVGGLARRMLDASGFDGNVDITTDLDRAVGDADFVLFQIRVGGQKARLSDETLPLMCGCIGQETTGAGGLAKAMRTIPVILEIADRVKKLAKEDVWIVDFTNPVGIVTRALLDHGHRAIGLCNVSITIQRTVAKMLGVEPSRIMVDPVGLNHLTFVRAVRLDGEDILPMLLSERSQELEDHIGFRADLMRDLGVIPSYYLKYFWRHGETLAHQRVSKPRATEVDEIEAVLLDMYKDPELREKPALLEQRGGAYYSEAAVGLVASLATDDQQVHVVDIRDNGVIPGLAEDDVVEIPARVGFGGAKPLEQRPLAPELLGLVQHVTAYERIAADAAARRDLNAAKRALLAHPLVGQDDVAERLVEIMYRGGLD